MADDADRAAEEEAVLVAAATTYRKPSGPVATGFCLNCDEPVPENHRWCDADCRNDWEYRMGRANV